MLQKMIFLPSNFAQMSSGGHDLFIKLKDVPSTFQIFWLDIASGQLRRLSSRQQKFDTAGHPRARK